MAIQKAIDKIQRSSTSRQINITFNTENGFFIASVHNLQLNLQVLIYQKEMPGNQENGKAL